MVDWLCTSASFVMSPSVVNFCGAGSSNGAFPLLEQTLTQDPVNRHICSRARDKPQIYCLAGFEESKAIAIQGEVNLFMGWNVCRD
jgi:hypothetical protein